MDRTKWSDKFCDWMEGEYHFNWEESKAKIIEDLVKLHKSARIFKKHGLDTNLISKKKWELRKKLVQMYKK
jgi:hypothetical protein